MLIKLIHIINSIQSYQINYIYVAFTLRFLSVSELGHHSLSLHVNEQL